MHVLGDLLRLNEKSESLPLPWWHRAPLGLLHDTTIYVSLVEGTARGVGELVVSVIDPNCRRIHVQCRRDDKPGVLTSVLQIIDPDKTNVNVALAEAVTIESGNFHEVTLVCELPSKSEASLVGKIQSKLRLAGFQNISVAEYHPIAKTIWHQKSRISHGKVRGVEWRSLLANTYSGDQEGKTLADFDLTKAVVTADLENRILRYVFPRRGAVAVNIRHADKTGTLKLLTEALGRCNLNILSALLRRGGNESGDATFIAVCEPLTNRAPKQTEEAIAKEIAGIGQEYRIKLKVNEGRNADKTIYGRHPDDITARVPEALRPMVLAARRKFPSSGTPIFLSRRFLPDDNVRASKLVDHLRRVLLEADCFAVEALPAPGDHAPAPFQVASKMWASSGAIVLVMDTGQDSAFSMNLAHEYGFMQGQGKPIMVLVERGQDKALVPLSNLHGLNVAHFASDGTAFAGADHADSIAYEVKKWIGTFETGEV
jgi:hypothetical protein